MTAMLRVRRRFSALLAMSFAAAACGDKEAPPIATTLQASTTTPSTAVAGSALAAGVKVLDDRGRPMKGVSVSFEVTGGGSVATPQATTDATGVASSGTWTLGTTVGTNTLVARSGSLQPVTFSVSTTPDAAAAIAAAPGNPATAAAGSLLNPAPGVRLTDRHGNPVQGVLVAFSSGTGTITGPQQTTGSDGVARPASWTLGGSAGVQTLLAVSGAFTLNMPVTVTAGPASVVQPFAGNLQTGNTGAPLPVRPAVRVTDAFNNPIAGVTVVFAVTAGGGTITGSPTVSDGNGIATAGTWTLGTQVGAQTLTATLPNGTSTTLSATAINAAALLMDRFAGHNTTCPVNTNACSFTVIVRNGAGQLMAGETVVWTNGTQTLTTTTNAQGRATASNLVTSATTGPGTQRARLEANGAEVTFSYELVQPGGYNIELRFIDRNGALSTPPASWQNIFTQVEQRWEQVITGDLSNVTFNGSSQYASSCGVSHPAMNETVDDMLIWVQIQPIDGIGNVLAQAGPCWIRNSNNLPIVGVVRLDSADVANMEANGTLGDVFLHEMGHTLGIGSMWGPGDFGLLQGGGGSDPLFTGTRAISSFQLTGGLTNNGVPVENCISSNGVPISGCGAGTRDSHWREATFARELMTGYINAGAPNPLSVITIGSLLDMGYQVNFGAADTYLMPNATMFGLRAPGDDPGTIQLVELPLPPPRVVR